MSAPRALVIALALLATRCSNVVRPEGGAGGDGGGDVSTDSSSSSSGWTVGGASGSGGAGGESPTVSCEGVPPGTFFIQFELPEQSFLLEGGCDRFPEFPYGLVATSGNCEWGTTIAGCSEEPGAGSFSIFTHLDEAGFDEVTGTFGSRSLLGNLLLSEFGEVGGAVAGELDGVITNDPSGNQISFHAELVVCRLQDLPPCP